MMMEHSDKYVLVSTILEYVAVIKIQKRDYFHKTITFFRLSIKHYALVMDTIEYRLKRTCNVSLFFSLCFTQSLNFIGVGVENSKLTISLKDKSL